MRLLACSLLLVVATGFFSDELLGQTQQPTKQTASEENKALVRRWFVEGFNKKDLKVVDQIFAETVTVNGVLISRENLKKSMNVWFAAFPDLQVTIDEIIGEDHTVGIWYTAGGTHRGQFLGIYGTGRQVKWSGFDLLRIENGKVTQARFIDDTLGLLRQLGATVLPPA